MRILRAAAKIMALCICCVVFAGNAFAGGVFNEGKITKMISGTKKPTLEIDKVKYLIMPHVQVFQLVQNKNSSWDMVPVKRDRLKKGTKVYYKAEEYGISDIYIKQ